MYRIPCLFVRGPNKNNGGFHNFQKRRDFSSLMRTKRSWRSSHNVPPPPLLALLKKAFPSLLLWPRREHTWTLSWKEGLLICFKNCLGVPYSHRQSRNRMMNTFIIVNITPICIVRDSLKDKSILVHFKKVFLLPSVWPRTEYTRALIWKKGLLICFESYPGYGIPYSPTQAG